MKLFVLFLLCVCCTSVFALLPNHPCYKVGDVNGDRQVSLSDAVFLNNYLFSGGPTPTCLAACNVDLNQRIDISDSISILQILFLGYVPPPGWNVCEYHVSTFPCGTDCCGG